MDFRWCDNFTSDQNILINVDPSCILVINSISDNECGASEQQTMDRSSNNIGVAVGSTIVVLILSLSVAIPIVAVLLFKWRKNRTRADEKRYNFFIVVF